MSKFNYLFGQTMDTSMSLKMLRQQSTEFSTAHSRQQKCQMTPEGDPSSISNEQDSINCKRTTHNVSDSDSSDDIDELEMTPLSKLIKMNGSSNSFKMHSDEPKLTNSDNFGSVAGVLNFNDVEEVRPTTPSALPISSDLPDIPPMEEENANNKAKGRKRRTPEEIAEEKRQKELKKEQKLKDKLEKAAKKEEEAAVKQAMRETKKQFKPGECLQYMAVVLDSNLVSVSGLGSSLLKTVDELGSKCETHHQIIENSVTWTREVTEYRTHNGVADKYTSQVQEDEVVTVLDANKLVEFVYTFTQNQVGAAIGEATLKEYLHSVQTAYPHKNVTLVVYGVDKYFRDQKTKVNRRHREAVRNLGQTDIQPKPKRSKKNESLIDVSRTSVDEVVCEASLYTGCNIHLIESTDEVSAYIKSITKAVSEKPAKKNRLECVFTFLEEGAKGVKVEKDGQGLIKVWKSQFLQFKNVSADVADALISAYQSPQLLMQAYRNCDNDNDKERLLENVVVRRGAGVLETNRRIGKELSRRIYTLFNSRDANLVIK